MEAFWSLVGVVLGAHWRQASNNRATVVALASSGSCPNSTILFAFGPLA
jgi:hypothetical protein